MRSAALLVVSSLLLATSSARYHEKTRYDRSIPDHFHPKETVEEKQRIFTDTSTHYTAYKDALMSLCYLEKTGVNELGGAQPWGDVIQGNKKAHHASERILTKIEAWRLAGGRIVEFCKGMTIIQLHEMKKPRGDEDPFFNEIPEDENDIYQKRVADLVLTPLKVRARRQAILEERNRANGESQERRKREAQPNRGKFRGQTQSQYLSVGNDGNKEGRAEAEATQQSSRAVVSGTSGMGQAQSMSSGADGCDGCPGYGSSPGAIGTGARENRS